MSELQLNWRRRGLEWLAASAILLLLWGDTAAAMFGIWWRSGTFAHCLLVPPIAAWLVWRDRARWMALRPQRWAAALLPMAAAALLGLLGELAQVAAASQAALIFMLQALTLFLLGPRVGRALAFPLLFLLFGIPIGEFLLPVMMERTADFTVGALRLFGIPVYREGLRFVIPSGHWSVVEACSGVRYLMASMMVGSLFAYLNFNRLGKRLAFVAVSIVVPLVANWLRAFMIVMLGHLSDNRIATGVDHLIYGWVFFGIVMAIMFFIGARYAEEPVDPAAPAGAQVAGRGRVWLLPALLLMLAPVVLARIGLGAETRPKLEVDIPGWAAQGEDPRWQPAIEKPPVQWQQRFASGVGTPVTLDLAWYPRQRVGSKAISGENQMVLSQDPVWQVLEIGAPNWRLRGPLDPASGTEQYLLQRWHWVDGQFEASPAKAKLMHVWQRLRGRGDAAALVVIQTPADAGAPARLEAFWQAAQAPLNACLQAAAQSGAGHNAGRCN